MLRIKRSTRLGWGVGLGFLAYVSILSDPRNIDWYETAALLLLAATIIVQLRSENY